VKVRVALDALGADVEVAVVIVLEGWTNPCQVKEGADCPRQSAPSFEP
jgi:hypothetical protein